MIDQSLVGDVDLAARQGGGDGDHDRNSCKSPLKSLAMVSTV